MQLAPTKRTPVALPRFSAGVSKSNEIWRAGYDSSFLPNSQISLLIPSTISSLAGPFDRSSCLLPAAENPRIFVYRGAGAEGAHWSRRALGAVRQKPLLVRNVWSDRRVYTRGLVSREAPSCPTGQTTSRTIARDDEGARARGDAESAVGPVPRKEALFH
ncbi:hypothetical protein ALC57_15262 [Trachymyrmex cornetzi]|uniref:Uncharacterized protein n=1 Tax=Trachymyrmex cornetzi TaxID=471704 RepID=A0A195DI14_9HYME|nr:hypothetical protein ALC57_15262 [Trachymyrmex cornetzi]